MRGLVVLLLVVLLVAQQDYWAWDDARLWFGFVPRTLAWQVGISLAAAAVWWLATRYCWPIDSATEPQEGRP